MSDGTVQTGEAEKGADVPAADIFSSHPMDVISAKPPKLPDDSRRCTARSKRTHERCKRFQTPGSNGTCYYHGSSTKAARALAARNLATRSAQAIVAAHDVEPMSDPVESLLRIARRVEMVAELIAARLDESSDATDDERISLIGAYRGALSDSAKVTASVISLDLLARRLEPPDHATARAIGQAVKAAIEDDEVDLDYETIQRFQSAWRRHMAEAFPGQ